jgi:hypothetical protein
MRDKALKAGHMPLARVVFLSAILLAGTALFMHVSVIPGWA